MRPAHQSLLNIAGVTLGVVVSGVVAFGFMLLYAGVALAQPVPVFDDAPSLAQLRAIMIPPSQPGAGRTIVIQRPDSGGSSVRPVSAQSLPAETATEPTPTASVTAPLPAEPPVRQASSEEPSQAPQASAEPRAVQGSAEPASSQGSGAVAFHINFAFNSAALPASARPMVKQMAMLMKEAPEVKVRIEGHTDAVGAVDYNVSLSRRRAWSVAEYLVEQGIEPSRLLPVGKGMAEPLTSNRYDPANRRVQFVRFG